MASLKDMKIRMQSVRTTRQMTSTMKVVSLAKLKRNYAKLNAATPYIDEMNRMVRRLIRAALWFQENSHTSPKSKIKISPLLAGNGSSERYVIVSITSDDGLSGAANLQVLQKTKEVTDYLLSENKEVTLICFGVRGGEVLKKFYPDLPFHVIKRKAFSQGGAYMDGERLTLNLMEGFQAKRFDACIAIFNHFESMVEQSPIIEQLIPNRLFSEENPWQFLIDTNPEGYRQKDILGEEKLAVRHKSVLGFLGHKLKAPLVDVMETDLQEHARPVTAYDYDPSATEILNHILPAYMVSYVNYILLESDVCDQAARLMAMDNATHNADEMLAQLTRNYQRTRQNKITTQTAELVRVEGT